MNKEKNFENPFTQNDTEHAVLQMLGKSTPSVSTKGRKTIEASSKKTNRVVCLMDDDLYNQMKEVAQRRHMTVSSFITDAVVKSIEA